MKFIFKESVEPCREGYRRLTEKNLNRISKGHDKDGYAILSASRASCSEEENNVRTKRLKDILRRSNYSYIAVYGGYKELGEEASLEKSLVVYPYNIVSHESTDFDTFEHDMEEIGKRFDQDSILVCEPGGSPHYVPLKDGVEGFGFDSVKYNDTDSEFFTAIKKWNDSSLNRKNHSWNRGKPQRYTFECYIQDYPTSRNVGHTRWASHDMNYSMNESNLKKNRKNKLGWWQKFNPDYDISHINHALGADGNSSSSGDSACCEDFIVSKIVWRDDDSDYLGENFVSNDQRASHYDKHYDAPKNKENPLHDEQVQLNEPFKETLTEEEYEERANKLAEAAVDSRNIHACVHSSVNRVVKYDSKNNEVVVYKYEGDRNSDKELILFTYFKPLEGIEYYKRASNSSGKLVPNGLDFVWDRYGNLTGVLSSKTGKVMWMDKEQEK